MGAFLPPAVSKRVPRVFQRAAAPANPRAGDLHADTAAAAVKAYFGGLWHTLSALYDIGTGRVVDVRAYLGAAVAAGIDVADGNSHPLSLLYADAAACAAAFPLTAAFMTTLGWRAIQTTDEIAWAAIQEAHLAAWPLQKSVYIPLPTASSAYLLNRALVLKTGAWFMGDRWAGGGTQLKARSDFLNALASGTADPIQVMARSYNPVGGLVGELNNTCRVYLDNIYFNGNSNTVTITDARISLGTPTTLTSAIGGFDARYSGTQISIPNAGAAGATLTTLATYVNANTLSLANAASVAITADQATTVNLGVGRFITDARISLGSPTTLTSATAGFDTSFTGSHLVIPNAGLNGGPLCTIATYVNATTLTLADAASVAITADQSTFCSRLGLSGTRFVLQQQSTAGVTFFNNFSKGIGLWVEGQDSKWDRISAFNSWIGLRLRDAQFQHIEAFNSEVWGFCAALLDGVVIGGSSCWFDKVHLENQSAVSDNTYAFEVVRGYGNSIRDIHFSEFAAVTKHNFLRISGIATQCSVDVVNFRNQGSSSDDDHYALRDYASGVHYTLNQVGREWGGYRSVRQADASNTNYPWAQDYAGPNGRRLRVLGSDPSLPTLDSYPGSAQTGDQATFRTLLGSIAAGFRADGRLFAPILSTPLGGFGQAQNFLKWSHDLSQWTLSNCVATQNDATYTAPDGSTTATKLVLTGTTNAFAENITGVTNQDGKTLCSSIWLKAASAGTIALRCQSASGPTITTYIANVTTEWQRFWFPAPIPVGETTQILFFVIRTSSSHLTTLWAWGAQVEEGSFPGPLVKTKSTVKSAATPGALLGPSAYAAVLGIARGSRLGYNVGGGTLSNANGVSYTVTVPGVKGPVSVADGAITSGTPNLTSATAAFTADDVGKAIQVAGAYSRSVADAAITSGAAVLTSATAAFTADDLGRTVAIAGAGVAGATLTTTIAVVTNATTVTVAANASTTVSGAALTITGVLNTSISAYVSATAVTLAANASATVSGAAVTLIREVWLCRALWSALAALGTKWGVTAQVTADDTVTVVLYNETGVSRTMIPSDTYVTAQRMW